MSALKASTLAVWRAVAAAGPAGTGTQSLYDRLKLSHPMPLINSALNSLIKCSYIDRRGVNRYGVWVVTDQCRVPECETRPVWLGEAINPEERPKPHRRPPGEETPVAMPAAPASVFNLAAPGPAGHAVLDWKAPPQATEPAEPAEPAEPDVPSTCPDEAQRLQPRVDPLVEDEGFLCALHSDGCLWIVADGRQFDLPLDYTRRLLHYLDHIRADALIEACRDEAHAGASA
jgi:hypothetical protein